MCFRVEVQADCGAGVERQNLAQLSSAKDAGRAPNRAESDE